MIAIACHEANKAFCEYNNDFSQKHWEESPQWQKDSAVNGVKFAMANPNSTPEDMHNNWLALKMTEGWTYGEVKDAEKKTHPCMVAYKSLPSFQKKKDLLFKTIVNILK